MRKTVLAAVAAGLVGAAYGVPSGPATAAGFSASVLVAQQAVSEPGIDVAPDGTIYVNAPRGLGGLSNLWRSDDGGSTWTITANLTRAAAIGGGDSDLSVAPDTGKLAWTDLSVVSSGVATSTDRGNTWLAQPMSVPIQDRQWVQAVRGNVAYHATHELAAGLVVSKSLDGGLTYPIHAVAAASTAMGCLCPPGYLIAESGTQSAGGNDKVGVSWSTGSGVRFARSVNGGLTWAISTITSSSLGETLNSFPVVANAGGDRLVAVWQEQSATATRIGFSKSTNWGQTWGPTSYIVTSGASVFPWVDARGTKVSVALYHSATGGNPNNLPSSAQWHLKYLESLDFGTTWTALATVDPTPAKSGKVCTNGLGCGSGRELGDFFQVVLDNAGMANFSYMRIGAGTPQVRFVKQV